jgi:hypothetical protein
MIEDRATSVLTEISRAFETLGELSAGIQERLMGIGEGAFAPMMAGIEKASSATKLMIDQVGLLRDAWGAAASAAERYGAAAGESSGVGRGGAGGRSRLTEEEQAEREAQRQLAEDRRNADAINRNENQIYSRQEAAARRENADRDRAGNDGPIGPRDRPFWGDDDDWQNAHAEDRNVNAIQASRRREEADAAREDEASRRASKQRLSAASGHAGGILTGMGPLIAGISGWEAEKAAMHEDQNIRQTLTALGITDDMPEYGPAYTRMHTLAYEEVKGTKFSNAEAAKINLASIPVLAKTGEAGLAAAEAVSPLALRLGELSAQRGGFNAANEAVAATEIAHLEQRFEPDQVLKTFDIVNAAARTTHTSILHQQEIDRYGVPTAMMLGIDPDKAIKDMASAQLRLGSTTTAGTGYSQFLLQATHFKGAAGAGLSAERAKSAHQEEREFERTLRLESPKDFTEHQRRQTKKKLSDHDQALIDLGIYSPAGKLMAVDIHGNLDDEKVKEDILAYATKHPERTGPMGWGTKVDDAFGVRGGRYAAAYGEKDDKGVPYLTREREQNKAFTTAVPVAKELEGLTHGPLQEFQQFIANIANTGNILATETLPGINRTFTFLNTHLIGFNDWLTQHQGAAQVLGYSALAGAAATTIGVVGAGASLMWRYSGARALTRGVTSLLGGAGGEAAAGAAAGEGVGEGVLLGGGLLGPAGLLAGGMLAAGGAAGAMNMPMVDDQGRIIGGWGAGDHSQNPAYVGAKGATPANITVHLGPVTMNGVPDDSSMHAFMKKMTDGIQNALSHMASDAGGSNMSPYTQP